MNQQHNRPPSPWGPVPASPPPLEPDSGNYIDRHWSGRLGFVHAVLVNGIGVSLVLWAATMPFYGRMLDEAAFDLDRLGAALVLLIIQGGVVFWQAVGIVRFIRRNGGRVAVVAGALLAAGLFQGLLWLGEQARVVGDLARSHAIGSDGPFNVSLSADGRTLLVLGEIGEAMGEEVERLLDRSPSVETVALAGPGGQVFATLQIQEMVRERGLDTVAVGPCASGCALIFLGGVERTLGRRGRLGFHRPGRRDGRLQGQATADAVIRHNMTQRGVDAAFIERSLAVPFEDIWFPRREELLKAGVVTRL